MLLYGAGEHAKIVREILASQNIEIVGIFDDAHVSDFFEDIPYQIGYQAEFYAETLLVISIGDNLLRFQISKKIKHQFGQAIHKQSWISPSAQIAEGLMISANVCIQTQAKIGKHSLINTAAVVEHDVKIGDFVHLAPASVIGARAEIGDFTLIGMNATILPSVSIGKNCIVGAGAVVTKDLPDESIAWGNPARLIRENIA